MSSFIMSLATNKNDQIYPEKWRKTNPITDDFSRLAPFRFRSIHVSAGTVRIAVHLKM